MDTGKKTKIYNLFGKGNQGKVNWSFLQKEKGLVLTFYSLI